MGMGFLDGNGNGMGMGMKSLKCEAIGTKNLFPHTSSYNTGGSASLPPVHHNAVKHVNGTVT